MRLPHQHTRHTAILDVSTGALVGVGMVKSTWMWTGFRTSVLDSKIPTIHADLSSRLLNPHGQIVTQHQRWHSAKCPSSLAQVLPSVLPELGPAQARSASSPPPPPLGGIACFPRSTGLYSNVVSPSSLPVAISAVDDDGNVVQGLAYSSICGSNWMQPWVIVVATIIAAITF